MARSRLGNVDVCPSVLSKTYAESLDVVASHVVGVRVDLYSETREDYLGTLRDHPKRVAKLLHGPPVKLPARYR